MTGSFCCCGVNMVFLVGCASAFCVAFGLMVVTWGVEMWARREEHKFVLDVAGAAGRLFCLAAFGVTLLAWWELERLTGLDLTLRGMTQAVFGS